MNRERYLAYRKDLNFSFQPKMLAKYVVMDLCLWSLFFILTSGSKSLALLAGIPLAFLFFRGLVFMHEAVHSAAHVNSKINYALGLISGCVTFLPYSLWKTIHVEHHYWGGNFEKDSALELIKRYPKQSRFMKGLYAVMWKTRFPWMACFQYFVFWAHSTIRLFKNGKDPEFWLSYLAPVMFWGIMLWKFNSVQLVGFASGFVVYAFMFDYINLAHHAGVHIKECYDRKPTWEQLEIARTGRYPKWLESMIMNFNFHAEHHMFPDLPWHELEKAHNLLKAGGDNKQYEVVGPGWLRQQRKKSFSAFFRPDLYGEEALAKQPSENKIAS